MCTASRGMWSMNKLAYNLSAGGEYRLSPLVGISAKLNWIVTSSESYSVRYHGQKWQVESPELSGGGGCFLPIILIVRYEFTLLIRYGYETSVIYLFCCCFVWPVKRTNRSIRRSCPKLLRPGRIHLVAWLTAGCIQAAGGGCLLRNIWSGKRVPA